MNNSITFSELCERVRADDVGKWDIFVPHTNLETKDDTVRLHLPRGYAPYSSLRLSPENDHALKEILWEAQACPDDPAGLLRLCCKDDRIRAVLPENAVTISNMALLSAIAPLMQPSFRVQQWKVTDQGFSLWLVANADDARIGSERFGAGLCITTSETGTHPASLTAMLVRKINETTLLLPWSTSELCGSAAVLHSPQLLQSAVMYAIRGAVPMIPDGLDHLLSALDIFEHAPNATLTALWAGAEVGDANDEVVATALRDEMSDIRQSRFGVIVAAMQIANGLAPFDRFRMECQAGKELRRGRRDQLSAGGQS